MYALETKRFNDIVCSNEISQQAIRVNKSQHH